MMQSLICLLTATSIALSPPTELGYDPAVTPATVEVVAVTELCKPSQVSCSTGCYPIGAACPSARELAPQPAPPSSKLKAEIAESRADVPVREGALEGPCLEPKNEFEARQTMAKVGLLGGSVASFILSGLIFAFARTEDESQGIFRKNCTIGKACGNTCISVYETCGLDSGSSGPTRYLTRGGLIAGSSFVAAGVILLVSGLAIPDHMKRRRQISCETAGCAVRF